MNKKKEKQTKVPKTNGNVIVNINNSNNINEKKISNVLQSEKQQAQFVPSKRFVEHHDYQNILDGPGAANKKQGKNVKNNNKSANIVSNESKNNGSKESVLQYRHFGDTSVMRHHKKPSITELVNQSNAKPYNKNDSNYEHGKSGVHRYSKNNMSYPDIELKKEKIQNIDCRKGNILISASSSSSHYLACDMTNDTGFSSLDGGDATTLTTNYSNLNPAKYLNIDVKDRVKMFGGDVTHNGDNANYRRYSNGSSNNNGSNNNSSGSNSSNSNIGLNRGYKQQHSAGSSSNLSSSNSNSSDVNSLDSMEHETIHRHPVYQNNSSNSKNTAGNHQYYNFSKQYKKVDNQRYRSASDDKILNTSNSNADSMSYLGPFNFRQLLRPTQGPTESLRKRKGINLALTPPPLQKGKV